MGGEGVVALGVLFLRRGDVVDEFLSIFASMEPPYTATHLDLHFKEPFSSWVTLIFNLLYLVISVQSFGL